MVAAWKSEREQYASSIEDLATEKKHLASKATAERKELTKKAGSELKEQAKRYVAAQSVTTSVTTAHTQLCTRTVTSCVTCCSDSPSWRDRVALSIPKALHGITLQPLNRRRYKKLASKAGEEIQELAQAMVLGQARKLHGHVELRVQELQDAASKAIPLFFEDVSMGLGSVLSVQHAMTHHSCRHTCGLCMAAVACAVHTLHRLPVMA
mgnify:CR=1 FL=1